MKFTVSQRVEVNKFCWVSKKMQIESSFSFKMCEVSGGKLLKAQLSVNFQNPMCVCRLLLLMFLRVEKASFALSKQAFLEETFNGVKTRKPEKLETLIRLMIQPQ